MKAKEAISILLAMYALKLVTHEQVVAWADEQILACKQPDPLLFDLSLDGPERCRRLPSDEFPPNDLRLSFDQAFSACASALDLEDDAKVLDFARWAARHGLGEDLESPLAQMSSLFYCLLFEIGDEDAAIRETREKLPALLPEFRRLWPHRLDTLRVDG